MTFSLFLLGWNLSPITLAFCLPLGIAAAWCFYFFRDPKRTILKGDHLVLSPCDGKVMEVEVVQENSPLKEEALRISVFLSIFDVHVQRAPMAGKVRGVEHQPGRFHLAFQEKAAEENERIDMLLETPQGSVLIKQIAGAVARRCVNTAKKDQLLARGERFGMIRFGSRVDLFLPPQAKPLVKRGDRVRAAVNAVAQFEDG